MTEEGYKPTQEEIDKAEESLTPVEKELSENFEVYVMRVYKEGLKCGLNEQEIKEALGTLAVEKLVYVNDRKFSFTFRGKEIRASWANRERGDWNYIEIDGVYLNPEERGPIIDRYEDFFIELYKSGRNASVDLDFTRKELKDEQDRYDLENNINREADKKKERNERLKLDVEDLLR